MAEVLVDAMRQHRIPGTALGILAGDREEHATFGVASLNSLEPVDPDTLFQIGSLAKTYTATVIWRLIDEGALALDAPVRTYIPDLRLRDEAIAAGVTVGNLLDHTAGWYGDEGFDTGEGDDALARYVAERLPQLPQLFPLGEFFSYKFHGTQSAHLGWRDSWSSSSGDTVFRCRLLLPHAKGEPQPLALRWRVVSPHTSAWPGWRTLSLTIR